MVQKNRVLRRISWPEREEVAGECRKLHNEELNDLYFLPSTVRVTNSRRLRLVEQAAHERERERRGVYRVLLGKHVGKRPLGRPRCK
jgi:hypothetical protein